MAVLERLDRANNWGAHVGKSSTRRKAGLRETFEKTGRLPDVVLRDLKLEQVVFSATGSDRRSAMSDAGVRFVCWVTPRDAVRSQAIELGWDPNSSESPSEYVEPTACEREYTFNSLDAALEFGRAFVTELNDWWGQVVVYREVRHKDQVYDPLEWKPEHKWVITEAGITHDEPVNDIAE